MATSRAKSHWQSLESLFTAGVLGTLSDRELLECFRANRDALGHEAFRILVERHGPMVLGVCRGLVRDPHDADDAFQATFLVLIRRADSIRRRDTIGPWLHGVAGRVALRARGRSLRRKRREVESIDQVASPASAVTDSPSAEQIIHDEIARLPEPLRGPVVLCCLEGLSYDVAGRRLRISEPTLRGRLHRARKRLAARLSGRGIVTGVFAGSGEPSRIALPPLSTTLVESTVQFATRWSSLSGLVAGSVTIPQSIAGLANGVITTMFLHSLKFAGVVTLLGAGTLATVVVAQHDGTKSASRPAAKTERASDNAADTGAADRKEQELTRQANLVLKTQKIYETLDHQLIDAEFPDGTTLQDILKHIKKETTSASFTGIPIYVNPLGLQDARVNTSTAIKVNLKQKTVRTVLEHTVRQLGLEFFVRDGFLMIDSVNGYRIGTIEMRVEQMDRKLDRVLETLERLEKAK